MTSAQSSGASLSKLMPRSFERSLRVSTWFFSHAPFWSLRIGSQQNRRVLPARSQSISSRVFLSCRASLAQALPAASFWPYVLLGLRTGHSVPRGQMVPMLSATRRAEHGGMPDSSR